MSTQDSPVEKILLAIRNGGEDWLFDKDNFDQATKDIETLLLEANIEGRKLEAERFGLVAQSRLRKLDNELKGSK